MMVSFVRSFFPRDVLDEILNLIESVSGDFPSYSFTVKHILIDCIDFLQTRNKYYRANDLPQLFQDVPVDNILLFLKEINIFYKI